MDSFLEDEPADEILQVIALHREARERVKFHMKIQAEWDVIEKQIDEQYDLKNQLIAKYDTIFESTNRKVNNMKNELHQQINQNTEEVNGFVKTMAKVQKETAKTGRDAISEEIDVLFRLKQNTERNTKSLQTFSDLKELGILTLPPII